VDTTSASLQMVVKSLKATIYVDQCHFGA
jgi:hypothetical protein